jgi:DNA polymerase-3 subunit delta'
VIDVTDLPDQPEARRLLAAAVEQPGHAYLFSGPPGSGKRRYAERMAAALLDSNLHRITSRTHPDLFVVEAEGAGIPVERARELRRDLHLRPFEAARRIYLVLDAHLLRAESANALLKSLEEPPSYGVFVLVSDHEERMLPTIRSRVATIPFRSFSRAQLLEHTGDEVAARAALGNLIRAEQLATDPAAAQRRRTYLELARTSAFDPAFDPAAAAGAVTAAASELGRAVAARIADEAAVAVREIDDDRDKRALERRYAERGKRAARRAETDELREAVDTVGYWYRDRLATQVGADGVVVHSDQAADLALEAGSSPIAESLRALDVVSDVRRSFELNVQPALAVEAMFHRLRHVAAGR